MLKLLTAAILGAILLAPGSTTSPAVASAPRDDKSDDPIVIVRHNGGMGGPIVTLHFALWEDGTMICPVIIAEPDSPLIVAKAPLGSADLLLERLREARFFDHDSMYSLPPDASYTEIQATDGRRANAHGFWEHIGTSSGDPNERWEEFLQMWLDSRAAILRVRPRPVNLVENLLDQDNRFRGYDPKRPERTPWLKSRWKPKADETQASSP